MLSSDDNDMPPALEDAPLPADASSLLPASHPPLALSAPVSSQAPLLEEADEADDGVPLQEQLMRAAGIVPYSCADAGAGSSGPVSSSLTPSSNVSGLASQSSKSSSGSCATTTRKSSFGLKRGFLLGDGGTAKKGSPTDRKTAVRSGGGASNGAPIVISPPSSASNPLRLSEVQEAMRRSEGVVGRTLSNTSAWLTPELIARMSQDPILVAGLGNPRFMAALGEMQKDSRAAMAKYKASERTHEAD